MLGSLPGRRPVVERGHHATLLGPLDAALHSLMMEPQRLSDRIKGGLLPVSQQHSRPLHPARRLSSRPRYRPQLRQLLPAKTQFDLAPSSCHELRLNRRITAQTTALPRPHESHLHANRFTESLVYVPLTFAPGEAYQFDWSHEIVVMNGVTTTVKVAHVRLAMSRMMFVRAYPRET